MASEEEAATVESSGEAAGNSAKSSIGGNLVINILMAGSLN